MAFMIVLILIFSAINILTMICHYCRVVSVEGTLTSCMICNSILYGLQWLCCLAYVLEVGKILKYLGDLCADARSCESDLCYFIQAFCNVSYMYICFLALSPLFYVPMALISKRTKALFENKPIIALPAQMIQMTNGYANVQQTNISQLN